MTMTQPATTHVTGTTGDANQWRAEALQLVNWGGFHGHLRMPLALTTTLLSGASGTGKSTLLDAYLALMMPSDTPFNGASNDATTGRARSADQRNLLTYLRGKTDTQREAGTGQLTDQVLRGTDSATWGAIAMTFTDDDGRRFTALRVYFVPLSATRAGEIIMKMATTDGVIDLRQLEPVAESRFDKRAVTTRFPDMKLYQTYAEFAQALYARLGIGAGGDGGKALRLLARIQGGQQIRTVDGLYKSLVLEEPATYAAADKAVSHFGDLDESYAAMVTEASKAKLLERLPGLHDGYAQASETVRMIGALGAQAGMDSPFTLWMLRTEAALIAEGIKVNRESRRAAADLFGAARDAELVLEKQLTAIERQIRANGGDVLERLQEEIKDLHSKQGEARNRRARFDERTEGLGVSPATAEDFSLCQKEAEAFLARFDGQLGEIEERLGKIGRAAFPLTTLREELQAEHDSLQDRTGLVPRRLHEARLAIARASGLEPSQLPFAAELIDLAPGQEQWRKAAEVTLFSVARVMLIDSRLLGEVSRRIDPVHIPARVNFQGVELAPHQDTPGDPRYISGKLVFKDSPFSNWLRGRVTREGTDALCVEDSSGLDGRGPRVTRNGQTRHGARGSHGELSDPPIIGFSNEERVAQIKRDLSELDIKLGRLGREEQELADERKALYRQKEAHQFVSDTEWATIDVAGIGHQITRREESLEAILQSSDILRHLEDEQSRVKSQLDDARSEKFAANTAKRELDREHESLLSRQGKADREQERITAAATVRVTDTQDTYLTGLFATVGNPEDLDAFPGNVIRLRNRLAEAARTARDQAKKDADSMTQIFEDYQGRWPDPNLGTATESCSGYRDILDRILATGLHERRQEWRRRLSEWSGQDLVPLSGAFDTAIDDIEERLDPVNVILSKLPFGPRNDRLKISLRRLTNDDVTLFRRELKSLSSGVTQDLPDEEAEARFTRLRAFIAKIAKPDPGSRAGGERDRYLDVRKHVEITAVRLNADGVEVATYASLGGKSGGETQELVAFIVGSALRYQLGDEDRARPRFAPVFLDEGFVKSDSEFAGRAVSAWKGLGFQLIIGAPLDKVTALEPYSDLVLTVTKSPKGYSHIAELRPQ
jgi:uncharacterized protein YPO0396